MSIFPFWNRQIWLCGAVDVDNLLINSYIQLQGVQVKIFLFMGALKQSAQDILLIQFLQNHISILSFLENRFWFEHPVICCSSIQCWRFYNWPIISRRKFNTWCSSSWKSYINSLLDGKCQSPKISLVKMYKVLLVVGFIHVGKERMCYV